MSLFLADFYIYIKIFQIKGRWYPEDATCNSTLILKQFLNEQYGWSQIAFFFIGIQFIFLKYQCKWANHFLYKKFGIKDCKPQLIPCEMEIIIMGESNAEPAD